MTTILGVRGKSAFPRIIRLGQGCFAASFLASLLAIAAASANTAPKKQLQFVGVNFAGATFGRGKIPGIMNKHYHYPNRRAMDYFLKAGFNTYRLAFKWERLQRQLGAEFDPQEIAAIDRTVGYLTKRGAYVILDVHNYARYYRKLIGSASVPVSGFTSLWVKLANRYQSNERVIFGLMNEPFRIGADTWRDIAVAAIGAIRATGARNLILVPGTHWSGAHSWYKAKGGISNAEALKTLKDPANNIAIEAHQYFDGNSSGTSDNCVNEMIGVRRLQGFTRWLRENNLRGFLGEFGAARNSVCMAALDNTLKYVAENADVWLGWTYWAAGAWWGNYRFSVHPSSEGDKPQMKVLRSAVDANANLPSR